MSVLGQERWNGQDFRRLDFHQLIPIADACNFTIRTNFLSQVAKRVFLELSAKLNHGNAASNTADKNHQTHLMDQLINFREEEQLQF